MVSAIDPTKPADGAPAVKTHLRANLQAAKAEIEALQNGKAEVGHNHILADVADAGTLAGLDQVGSGEIASDALDGRAIDMQGGGSKVYFGGSQLGLAGAGLPVDTAKRIVLTQGAAGATLYLDDTEVAKLASVTRGWSALSGATHIGCGRSTGHANDRSPLWGRVDQIEVWQGQLALPAVQGLAGAAQSVIWKAPTTGPLIDISDHAGDVQAAIEAAAAVNGFVYQSPSNLTVYTIPAHDEIAMKCGCRGVVGLRLCHTDIEDTQQNSMIAVNQMGAHGDPWAAEGGWKFIGCRFDSNARAAHWASYSGSGLLHTGFGYNSGNSGPSMQHHHALRFGTTGSKAALVTTALVDVCDFVDGIGDAVSCFDGATITAESCRIFGWFRGAYVINNHGNPYLTVKRSESHMASRVEATQYWNGCGLCDLEPFQTNPGRRRSAPAPKCTITGAKGIGMTMRFPLTVAVTASM